MRKPTQEELDQLIDAVNAANEAASAADALTMKMRSDCKAPPGWMLDIETVTWLSPSQIASRQKNAAPIPIQSAVERK
jgi:hypothetical protein